MIVPMIQVSSLFFAGGGFVPHFLLVQHDASFVKNSDNICYLTAADLLSHILTPVFALIWLGSVDYRIRRFFTAASSVFLTNMTLETSKHLNSLEVY